MPFANLSDVRMFYDLLGDGPPILMVPGLGMLCSSWGPTADLLAEHYSVIMPDLRGMGQSREEYRPATHLSDLASDLVELMDHLQIDTAHVMGVSLGGVLSQQLVIDHPSRVDRLVLVSCTDRFSPYLREITMLLGRILRHFPQDIYYRTIELLGTAPEFLDQHPHILNEKARWAKQHASPRRALARQLRCLGNSDVGAGEYNISCPTLVVAAEYDVLIPNCYARRMAERIPNSEFFMMPASGHNPLTEVPEMIVPRIVKFLSEKSGLREKIHKLVEV